MGGAHGCRAAAFGEDGIGKGLRLVRRTVVVDGDGEAVRGQIAHDRRADAPRAARDKCRAALSHDPFPQVTKIDHV